jgi:succinate dehydrogenase / fumarate reductase flavoprotein subunit
VLRDAYWQDLTVTGEKSNLNPLLDYAGRVADYMEFGELLALDAQHRNESCGGHFREEYQTPDGEAQRNDDEFCHAAVWEWVGDGRPQIQHQEPLAFENVHLATRSYK